MKVIFFLLSFLISSCIFSQETEIKAALKSAESENWLEVKEKLTKAQSLVATNKNKLNPNLLSDYYYAKGMSELKDNNITEAAKSFAELNNYDAHTTYSLKNKDTKEKLFFTNKIEAEKTLASGNFSSIKESSANNKYTDKVKALLSSKLNDYYTKAQNLLNAKDYQNAGINFETAYFLTKALNLKEDKIYYYAALTYQNAKKYAKAHEIYDYLIASKFNGVSEEYELTEIATGTKSIINKQDAEFYKLDKKYSVAKTHTPSLEKELYTNAAVTYEANGKADKAIELIKNYLKTNPKDKELNELLANLFIRANKSDEYLQFAENLIASDPNNALNYFNLGVIYSKIKGKDAMALQNYDKAISLDPTNYSSYLNASLIYLNKEKPIMEQLKKVGKDRVKEGKLRNERKEAISKAIPYLEKALEYSKEAETKNSVLKTLKDCYKVVGNTAKLKELDQK